MKKSQLKKIIRNIINEERSSSIPSHYNKKYNTDGGGDIYYDPRLEDTINKRDKLLDLMYDLNQLEMEYEYNPTSQLKNRIDILKNKIQTNKLHGGYNKEYNKLK